MTAYVFVVDRVEVVNCKSKGQHNDDDWLHVTVGIGNQTPVDSHFHINENIHAGDSFPIAPNGPFVAGPFEISDDSRVFGSYVIENKSHTDAAKQEAEVIQVGTVLVTAMFGAIGLQANISEFNADEIAAFVLGTVVAAAGTVWATLVGNSDPNCNGEVLTKALGFERGDLAKRGTHTISDEARVGPSKEDCGNPPVTKVTYSVRVWTLRTAMQTRGLNLSAGLRPIQPPVHSVRAFMGL